MIIKLILKIKKMKYQKIMSKLNCYKINYNSMKILKNRTKIFNNFKIKSRNLTKR